TGSSSVGLPAQWASQLNQLADPLLAQGATLTQQVKNQFVGLVQTGPRAHAAYPSAQMTFRKRFSSSLITAAYTISKETGNTESRSDWLEGGAQGSSMGFTNNNNRRMDRSLQVADTPQRFSLSYTLELPFGPGKPYLSSMGPAGRLV